MIAGKLYTGVQSRNGVARERDVQEGTIKELCRTQRPASPSFLAKLTPNLTGLPNLNPNQEWNIWRTVR